MKPNGIGNAKEAASRTPIYNNLRNSVNDNTVVDDRPVSQLSVPLSAIRSVESSRGSKDLMASKQLTSMMLVSDGINTTRHNYRGEGDDCLQLSARERLELNTHRSNEYANALEASLAVGLKSNDSPIRLAGERARTRTHSRPPTDGRSENGQEGAGEARS